MRIKDQEAWDKWVAANTDPYGAGVLRYAQKWAELMEVQIEAGKVVKEVAKQTSHEANEEGITGFMYGAAVCVLSECWHHGEDLRQWHNLDTQIGNEGEIDNQNGGVLSPAVLNIGGGNAN